MDRLGVGDDQYSLTTVCPACSVYLMDTKNWFRTQRFSGKRPVGVIGLLCLHQSISLSMCKIHLVLSTPVPDHSDPLWEENGLPCRRRPPDPDKEWVRLSICTSPPLLPPYFLFIRATLCASVLHAMRDDSEKVPALLTDYILKGTHTHAHTPLEAVSFFLGLQKGFSTH